MRPPRSVPLEIWMRNSIVTKRSSQIPPLNVQHPPESYPNRSLVRFRAMVQDTSLSTEMYLYKHSDGSCGGWGMYADDPTSSGATDVDYNNLQECNVLWATTVPAESHWCRNELDGDNAGALHTSSNHLCVSFCAKS